jgi:hypothetical protein
MKKIFLVLAAVALCVSTASAKGKFVETVTSQKWSVGLRATYGIQAVAECFYSGDKYLEGRLGLFGGLAADFTVLHNWNVGNWDWTPKVGKWYLDAGVGGSLGGSRGHMYGGVTGDVKFGIKFKKVPIRLAVDYSPMIAIGGFYGKYKGDSHNVHLYGAGFANAAISATWCF